MEKIKTENKPLYFIIFFFLKISSMTGFAQIGIRWLLSITGGVRIRETYLLAHQGMCGI
jgi:hypothetical protein